MEKEQLASAKEIDLDEKHEHLKHDKTNILGVKSLLCFLILVSAWLVGFSSRLFAVVRFESIIHEFDPWFNYRSTHYLVENGFYNFLNWFDERAWYPLGRIVGGTVYPGLMITAGAIHWIMNTFHLTVHIRDVCVFLAPFFSGLTAIATYFLTKELWNDRAGLFAACFIAIAPGYISRSVAGSYDNEGIAIFALQFTYFLWVSAWGGYVFIINLIPLHVFTLLLMGRYSNKVYTSYSVFFIVGLLCSMQVPFVGFQPVRTSEHMAAAGVFALIQAYAFIKFLRDNMTRSEFKHLFNFAIVGFAGLVFLAVVGLTYLGYIAPWSGRFYSLFDTGYAKIHIPIIASVSEHQPTTWVSFFFDLHVLICAFPYGVYICVKKINNERVFIVLYAVSAVYFAGVMVRLMLTLTPVVCILSAITFSSTLDNYLKEGEATLEEDSPEKKRGRTTSKSDHEIPKRKKKDKDKDKDKDLSDMQQHEKAPPESTESRRNEKEESILGSHLRTGIVLLILLMLMLFAIHCTWVTSNAYSSPSIVLASTNYDGSRNILDDFREAYFWLRQNTDENARVMSWWDYGYQIAGMANRTTMVDNNTWNNSHIALVGKAMSSNESAAYEIMRSLNVDYVLVIFGGVIGYSGDDINKFLWMVRIAEGEHPKDIREADYFTPQGEFRIDRGGSPVLLNCLMYKLCYYRFGEMQLDFRAPSGYDRTRNAEIGNKDIKLTHLEEAYTTEHWLVRIYRVKNLDNRPKNPATPKKKVYKSKYSSYRSRYSKSGVIKNKLSVKEGKRIKRNKKSKKSKKSRT
eukprot:gene3161-3630_t